MDYDEPRSQANLLMTKKEAFIEIEKTSIACIALVILSIASTALLLSLDLGRMIRLIILLGSSTCILFGLFVLFSSLMNAMNAYTRLKKFESIDELME